MVLNFVRQHWIPYWSETYTNLLIFSQYTLNTHKQFWFKLSTITMNHSHSWGESGHEINIQNTILQQEIFKKNILKKSWLIYQQQHNIYKLVLKFIYTKPHTTTPTQYTLNWSTRLFCHNLHPWHSHTFLHECTHTLSVESSLTHTLLRNERKQTKQKINSTNKMINHVLLEQR